ncbi:MAG TPA: type III polyketide synthase [Longimicrobiales bacterium]|nr:type III polyketide synthase [Longimicrobiales bacterium]
MTLALAGFGTALPEHRFTQAELAELHAGFCRIDRTRERTLKALYRRSGVKTRASVILDVGDGPLDERQSFYRPARDESDPGPATAARMRAYAASAPRLAVSAAGKALASAGASPKSVTHLITVSCTGFMAPGIDASIVEELGLSPTTQRTHVGFMGCHGSLNGLRVARSFADGSPDHVSLVCSVELCTLHFSYGWDPDMMVANALFGDGAAAVVGRSANGAAEEWRVGGTGTFLIPGSRDDMTWRIGDHGFRMTLSARVPDLIEAHLRAWVARWLIAHDLTLEDVASWAVHPGGPRIVSSVQRALGIDSSHAQVPRAVLSEYGNMSSATILFILDRLERERAPRPCVALAFGPGLVVEALLIV